MLDVCLILEGTYPYVAGGVSTWVHQLITALQDIRFGIVYITTHADPTRHPKYDLPPQVALLQECYLHHYTFAPSARRKATAADYSRLYDGCTALVQHDPAALGLLLPLLRGPAHCFDLPTLIHSPELYRQLNQWYERTAADQSYLDFFWTFRGMVLPLLQLATTPLPPAKIYHAVTTGYAGLLAGIAKLEQQGACFVTEHGIYTHERMLEIAQATWIYEPPSPHCRITGDVSFFKQWWINFFRTTSRLAYQQSDRIFTLFEEQKLRQIADGAAPEKITIIPNGIDVAAYRSIVRTKHAVPQIGFIGRIVPIKDLKTFLQAARLLLDDLPTARFFVIGPADEEPDYVAECQRLAAALHLTEHLEFAGRVDVRPYYAQLDVIVLTSLSEGQPYVILEANAAGVPVVATDVGACRRLLEGSDAADRALGTSGLLTAVSSPEQTAHAVRTIATDPALAHRMGVAGRTRVAHYYDQDDLFSRYLNAYEQVL